MLSSREAASNQVCARSKTRQAVRLGLCLACQAVVFVGDFAILVGGAHGMLSVAHGRDQYRSVIRRWQRYVAGVIDELWEIGTICNDAKTREIAN